MENNKLIAKFMSNLPNWAVVYEKEDGHIFYRNPWSSKTKIYDDNMQENGFYYIPTCTFNFHTDWNWLMDVVDKIEGMGYWTDLKTYKDEYSAVIGEYNYDNNPISVSNKKKILAVYNAVVQFIKSYNNQNRA